MNKTVKKQTTQKSTGKFGVSKEGNEFVGWGKYDGIGIGLAAYLVPQILVGVILGLFAASLQVDLVTVLEAPTTGTLFFIAAFSGFVGSVAIAWYVQRKGGMKALGFRMPEKKYFLYVIPIYILYFISLLILLGIVEEFAPSVDLDEEQELGFDRIVGAVDQAMIFVTLVIFAPIFEEILFRGFVFQGIARKHGFWIGAIAVSALFGLAHGQINVAIDTFVLGMFAAWLVWQSKSLLPAILLHGLKNVIAYISVFVLELV